MMAKTRSQTKLRRGRSETRTLRFRQGSRKPTTLNRLPRKDLFQRRSFTIKRQERAKLFVEKANQNSKRYGAFGSEKWLSALLSEINEPGVVLLANVRVWFNLHLELFQNTDIVASTHMPILEEHDEQASFSSSFQISDDAETLSWTPSFEIDGQINSDFIHKESQPSWDAFCCDADALNNVHQIVHDDEDDRGLNIDLPNRAEKEPIIDLNRLNDYKIEEWRQLTMNAAEIIEDDITCQQLEADIGFAGFPVSTTSHNYQTDEFGQSEEQIGVNLSGVDQGLMNEVLIELDKFFIGVHIDQIVKMVNDLPSTTSTDSGIDTETDFSEELLTPFNEELQMEPTSKCVPNFEPLVTKNSQECRLSMDVDGVRKFQFVFESSEFSAPPKQKISMIHDNLTNFRLVMNAFENLAFTYEDWDGFLIDPKNEWICKILNVLKHEFYTIEMRQLKKIASSEPTPIM